MQTGSDDMWYDEDAGRLIRPYTVSGGRTRPSYHLDLLSVVTATGRIHQADLDIDHAQALDLCHHPISVVEVSAYLRLPVSVTKVLLADLVDCRALTAHDSNPTAENTDRSLLEAVLDGLQRRL